MPKVRSDIKDLNMYARSSRIEDKYPFLSEIADGKVHELVAGKDFVVATETMRQSMKLWATRQGIPLVVKTEGENILVQMRKTPTAKRKAKKR